MSNPRKLLSVKELCDTLQVRRSTIYQWRKDGKIPEPVKRWGSPRYDWDEIKTALGKRKSETV